MNIFRICLYNCCIFVPCRNSDDVWNWRKYSNMKCWLFNYHYTRTIHSVKSMCIRHSIWDIFHKYCFRTLQFICSVYIPATCNRISRTTVLQIANICSVSTQVIAGQDSDWWKGLTWEVSKSVRYFQFMWFWEFKCVFKVFLGTGYASCTWFQFSHT